VARGGERTRDRVVRHPRVLGRHRLVEIRPERHRLAPIGHRQARVQPRGFAERAQRFGMVEGIQQPQPLIEEPLGPGSRRGDRHVQRAEPAELRRQRRIARLGAHSHGHGEQKSEQKKDRHREPR
jgi:hypothetical protein